MVPTDAGIRFPLPLFPQARRKLPFALAVLGSAQPWKQLSSQLKLDATVPQQPSNRLPSSPSSPLQNTPMMKLPVPTVLAVSQEAQAPRTRCLVGFVARPKQGLGNWEARSLMAAWSQCGGTGLPNRAASSLCLGHNISDHPRRFPRMHPDGPDDRQTALAPRE